VLRRALSAVFMGCLALLPLAVTGVARADTPFAPSAQLTDRAGVLSSAQKTAVQNALDNLYNKDRIKLFITYVKNFSGVSPTTWVDQSAALGGMGRRDILLGIATQGRQYAVSADKDVGLTNAQLDNVGAIAIEPALRAGDWAAAGIGAADGYAAALAGQPVAAPTINPNANAATGTSTSSSAGAWIAILVVLALLALLLYFFMRRRRAGAAPVSGPGGAPAMTIPQLEAKAGHLLVATDDAIKTSEQELGFATAQFGDEATAPFTAAMKEADSELAAAFKLRQLLDDDIPEDDSTKRQMLTELIAHCEKANELLDAQATAFAKLRDLEANAPEIIPQLQASAQQHQARLTQARATLAQLTSTYAPTAVAPVAGNADEAASRIQFSQAALAQAEQALTGQADKSRIATLVQAAQLADDQVSQLLDGIDRRAGELSQARAALEGALGANDANIAEAATSGQQGLREPAVRAQTVAAQVRTQLGTGPIDPIAALRDVEEASTALDQALAQTREQQVRQQRARESLEQAVLTARSSISAADDFITTHRGAVGSTARTRVAEAERHLQKALALAPSDPEQALAQAQQADAMADQAYQEARQDVSGYAAPQQGAMAGLFGGGGGGGGGTAGMVGAMLGGILINSVLSGGGGGGGPRGGGMGRVPQQPTAGSFGGASRSGRQSVGGRF
jgi:LPXTG-motif cell wall-anchored protein